MLYFNFFDSPTLLLLRSPFLSSPYWLIVFQVRNCSSGISALAKEFEDFGSSSMSLDLESSSSLPQHEQLGKGDRTASRIPEVAHRLDREHHDRLRPYHKIIFQGVDHTPYNLREEQDEVLRQVPNRVRLAVESPYGKDSIDRCFATEKTFRHTWIYLFKSGCLLQEDLEALFRAFTPALLLWAMLQEHALVDFRDLKTSIPTGVPAGAVMHRWSRMFTACLLHFNLDLPSAIRYVGHIHTGSHRDWKLLESTLQAAKAGISFIDMVRRVYFDGCPNYVNATSTEANRRAYAEYGNHPSVYKWESLTKKALQKDVLRSYTLLANPALSPFMPNIHQNPQGMVVPVGKNPRQICDESFHPQLDSMAANDWVDIENEPDIIFPTSLMVSLVWLYNLRLSHPNEELYIGDDDVSGAFRHAKFNPNVVGLHAFMLFGFLFFATGQTFGGEPGPSNWEVLAIARMKTARYLWTLSTTIKRALPFLPKIETTPSPTPAEVAAFVPAERDSINRGVRNSDDSRKPPEFRHHVDDCMYADTGTYLLQTVSASVLALYIVLGFPDKERGIRDCVSWEKFQSTFTYTRKTLGWIINSRRLTVGLPDEKRDTLIALLQSVLDNPSLTIREIAVLLGHLDNATTVKRDMKCAYFNLGRLMRVLLWQRYHAATNWCRRNNREVKIQRLLPKQFQYRLGRIISRTVTDFLWNSGQRVRLEPSVLAELARIKHSLESEPWEIYIPQIIPRDPHFISQGDASLIAGGAYCISLNYWFRVVWSPELAARCHLPPADAKYVHINSLEFLVSLLQVVAAVATFEECEDLDPHQLPSFLAATFPTGLPQFPVMEAGTDNTSTESWTGSVRTTSVFARALVHLFGQLLARTNAVVRSKYIPGVDNIVPDFLSRPDQIISHEILLQQTYQRYLWIKNLRFFHPSPELILALRSSLFSSSNQDLPVMPKQLGHFAPAGSTTSAFVLI